MSEPVVSLRDGETLADYAIRVTRALDQQRDEARAEIARLTRERDAAIAERTEFLEKVVHTTDEVRANAAVLQSQWNALEAERDTLRALLRECRAFIGGQPAYLGGLELLARLDAALGKEGR